MTDKIYVQIGDKKRVANAEEVAQLEKDQAEAKAEASRIETEQLAKAAKLESAKAKLSALGLDDEEVKAIIGA